MSYTYPQARELASRHGLAFSRPTWTETRAIFWYGQLLPGVEDGDDEDTDVDLMEVDTGTGVVQKFVPDGSDSLAGDWYTVTSTPALRQAMLKPLGPVTHTARGFELVAFQDRYDLPCELQASSLAEYATPGISAVWLGPDPGIKPQIMKKDALRLGLMVRGEVSGWMDYDLPKEVRFNTRMHLDRPRVKSLIAHLQAWLVDGTFALEPPPTTGTIRCFCVPLNVNDEVRAVACDDDGITLTTHHCSSGAWAKKDLMERQSHLDVYAARYPGGYTMTWLEGIPEGWLGFIANRTVGEVRK